MLFCPVYTTHVTHDWIEWRKASTYCDQEVKKEEKVRQAHSGRASNSQNGLSKVTCIILETLKECTVDAYSKRKARFYKFRRHMQILIYLEKLHGQFT